MTTLERLIDTLRGIDGPVTLDEVQVRELVAWFETARRSIADTATYAVELRDDLVYAAVDEAVEAEREECARVAENCLTARSNDVAIGVRGRIAEVIRARGGK